MRRLLPAILIMMMTLFVISATAQARPRFQVRCFSSHIANDDPIAGSPSHEHEFFGNLSTNRDSTYQSMTAANTNCSASADTAGYWTPTVFRPNDDMVRAQSLLIYYRGDERERTRAFPANLKMISDDFAIGPDSRNLIVKFPECWDGEHLDSSDHRAHMTFDQGGQCPASHPVRVPALTEVFRYPVSVGGFHLSSGPMSTGHADFWNTWQQNGLEDLVDRCLQPGQDDCGRIDG
jgi:hypothetical protein